MAQLIVEVSKIDSVAPHENADSLELAQIKGWQCVVPKGRYQAGDVVTYIPIDSVIPVEHSDRWNITKYLANGRVRCARLRGEPSFGVVIDREDASWPVGMDVAESYGITKYIPPFKAFAGDAIESQPLFVSYTEVENLRNFPGVLQDGEQVCITEKIHGTNSRVGCIEGEFMAGSMQVRRRKPEPLNDSSAGTYWYPLTLPGVSAMIDVLSQSHRQVILFGEVYGSKIQNLNYGKVGCIGYAAFDLLIDGKYVDFQEFADLCHDFDVTRVPVLHLGEFSMDAVKAACKPVSTLQNADHIMEGVVIRPVIERTDPKVGRVCLKYISDDYLLAKGISDTNDV